MIRRISQLSLILLLPLLLLVLLGRAANLASQEPDWNQKIDPALAEIIAQGGNDSVRVLLHLHEQANVREGLPQNEVERRVMLVERLQSVAATSQQNLRAALQALQESGKVTLVRPLWIVNAIIVELEPEAVPALAQRHDVAHLALDARQQFLQPPQLQPQEAPPSNWNLTQIRAPHVWNGLGVTGLGVTVAIMDTGVDWSHPDLRANYRGLHGDGSVRHEGNWFDALHGTSDNGPFDPNGHGTHVAGTAVGRGGTGVAPDARWIAVRAFDSGGFATTGDLHLAFQWLLAPGGAPELAPDIVNGSWSGAGSNPVFEQDLRILHEAGISTIFAAGNNGPEPGTIGAPASYEGAVAVAAVDYRHEVTWFSSRGPSSLTDTPKPDLAAPGARVYSTLPNGHYGYYNGTSMATPHVSGVAALLLSANPHLDVETLRRVLTETARNGSAAGHDIHQGWGQLDAYAAVASQMHVGQIRGAVTAHGEGVAGAVITVTSSAGASMQLRSDHEGFYRAWLRPGAYRLRASKFGYSASAWLVVQAPAGGTAHQNLTLSRLQHTEVRGVVRAAASGEPLANVKIIVENRSISAATDANGRYSLALPTGATYTLRASRNGFRLSESALSLPNGDPTTHDFSLSAAQSILLVDSGRWYYDSHLTFYQKALLAAGYAFDEWHVYSPLESPPASALAQYDTVIWTAPQDAPGWIGAGDALVNFLDSGGNLLISGQNVARRDGIKPTAHAWFTQYLQGDYLTTAASPFTVTTTGLEPYTGLHFSLNPPESAANQIAPSVVAPTDGSLTQPVLQYQGGEEGAAAALWSGRCQPYRLLFLGFGLEGAGSEDLRADLIRRSLDSFEAPRVERALALNPRQTNEVMLPGETLTITFSLQNLSEVHTSTIDLEYDSRWASQLSHTSVRLGPCQQQPITLTLRAPSPLPEGARQAIELTARADYGAIAGASVVATAPEPTLLVADYRWYDETPAYRDALNALHLSYDIWDTNQRGSPSFERMAAYEHIVWFTGYDWYEPLTTSEISALQRYLDMGGRLYLSSQDYLFYHRDQRFTRDYLGVLDYQESLTSTVLLGGHNALVGEGIGPLNLSFDRYRNFSDGLEPAPTAGIHLWNDWGSAVGTVNSGPAWRSIFWGTPFELLTAHDRAMLLQDVMGRLSDIGDSTFEVSPRIASASTTRQFTITVNNWNYGEPHTVSATATLPPGMELVASSHTDGVSYDQRARQLHWQGSLQSGADQTITFQARPDRGTQPGTRLNVTTTVSYDGIQVPWQNVAPIWIDTPDLSPSTLEQTPRQVRSNQRLTYTAVLSNVAPVAAEYVTATLTIPLGFVPVTPTLQSSSGIAAIEGQRVWWHGSLDAGAVVTFTVSVSTANFLQERALSAGLVVDDGMSAPLIRRETAFIFPHRWFLPLVHH